MSDERPLRQEDYRAMAEENRRLREEVAKLKPQSEIKASRSGNFWIAFLIGVTHFAALVFCVWGLKECDDDIRERKNAVVDCFLVKRAGDGHPWDPYTLYEKHVSKHYSWDTEVQPQQRFDTLDEARDFLKKHDARMCAP